MEDVIEIDIIKIKIEGDTIDFETARMIAEAIANRYNMSIIAWHDNVDGDYYPTSEEEFNKCIEKANIVIEVEDYIFYIGR